MNHKIKVTFEPSGRSVDVLPGTILLEAAARAGFIIETPCGGTGKCGKCRVRITSGHCETTNSEYDTLGPDIIEQGFRMACQSRVTKDIVVEIPENSLFYTGHKILAHSTGNKFNVSQRVKKQFLSLKPHDRETSFSDADLIKKVLGSVNIDISVLRSLPYVLREDDFKITVTIIDNRVVDIESGNKTTQCYGIAFDIGTTTIVGTLVDIFSGTDIAISSMINPQTSFCDDVISRIKKCREEENGLQVLHETIIKAVKSIINELLEKSGIERNSIYKVVFAGNTTMQEILCNISPSFLGEMPFVPVFRECLKISAQKMDIGINTKGDIHIFPQIGGFVGGDTVAGIIATRLDKLSHPALLVDVGTNGEIVLANKGKLIATSVAAGPAFEGARIITGMRAANGAIEKVVINNNIQINVIGNSKPSGICGTGLIDTVAELLRIGVIDETGRILEQNELPNNTSDYIKKRIIQHNGQICFLLVDQANTSTGEPLCLYQKDIRELQLANAAIRAGINILLKIENLNISDLGSVLLAGAFGNFIRRNNAKRIGMLPQIPCEHIRFVGNTASFGAKLFLLSSSEMEYAIKVMNETNHIDLSLNSDFQMEFSSAMIFPTG